MIPRSCFTVACLCGCVCACCVLARLLFAVGVSACSLIRCYAGRLLRLNCCICHVQSDAASALRRGGAITIPLTPAARTSRRSLSLPGMAQASRDRPATRHFTDAVPMLRDDRTTARCSRHATLAMHIARHLGQSRDAKCPAKRPAQLAR